MATTLEDRIKAQEEKLKQLKALKQKQEAQKRAAEAKKARSDDTRRKVLIGAMVLDHMSKNDATKNSIMDKLNAHLTRPDDRALFNLKPVTTIYDVMKKHSPALFEKKAEAAPAATASTSARTSPGPVLTDGLRSPGWPLPPAFRLNQQREQPQYSAAELDAHQEQGKEGGEMFRIFD